MKALQILSSLLTASLLAACASAPPAADSRKAPPAAEGPRQVSIEGRLQVQNKAEKKTITLTALAFVAEPSNLRLDLNGPFGKPLAKVVIRGESMGLLVPGQKKAYIGAVSDYSLKPVLPMTLHPRAIMSFLLGDVPADWECVFEAPDKQACVQKERGLMLTRDPRPEMKKAKWRVDGETFSMVFLPTDVKTNVQPKPDTFTFAIPDGYSRHKLP